MPAAVAVDLKTRFDLIAQKVQPYLGKHGYAMAQGEVGQLRNVLQDAQNWNEGPRGVELGNYANWDFDGMTQTFKEALDELEEAGPLPAYDVAGVQGDPRSDLSELVSISSELSSWAHQSQAD
ncbi:hypothetical protein [Streptomyces sp. 1222.5]|uniref:hypothetical protein n=1 Tax=Streptomyces sp. 1222.5 TaxID=1881026 RepID=UPI003D758CFF